jgi:thiol-disulfide isomerase/thioredoxin
MTANMRGLMLLALAVVAATAGAADGVTPREATVHGTVVDEAGAPVAGAVVLAPGLEKSRPTTCAADGTFRLPLGYPERQYLYATLLARGKDGRLGFQSVEQEKPSPVRLVLKPSREVVVEVRDRGGKPVSGADISFVGGYRRLAGDRTDAAGRWVGRVPADVADWAVCACLAGRGFDFAVARPARRAPRKPQPLPGRITLALDGARPLRVQTVDRQGKPLPGVTLQPLVLRIAGREDELNVSGLSELSQRTGPDGAAVFDWLPQLARGIQFSTRADGSYAPDLPYVTSDKLAQGLTVTMLPLERLAGRVTHADGRPAAGIRVTASGQGAGMNGFHDSARTGPDGRYTMQVYSEQAYIIAVTEERWAAPYRADVVVRAGKPIDGVDFVLGPATRVHGTVTVGKDGRLVARPDVRVDVSRGEIPPELQREGDRTYHEVRMVFWPKTDAQGHFEFHLGPGEYQLVGPSRTKPVKITIPAGQPPAEIVQDFRMPRPETGPFTLRVTDAEGRPVAGAVIDGEYASQEARRYIPREKTDEQGQVTFERSLDPLVLYARTADGPRAGVVRVAAEEGQARLVLGPVARASGRLVDLSDKPVARKKVLYGIRVYQGQTKHSPFRDCFGGSVVTDDAGRFTLAGLVLGETYQVTMALDEHSSRGVATARPETAASLDLGQRRVDPEPPRPYVPPTPGQRVGTAFAASRKVGPSERKQEILTDARLLYTRPLLLLGRPKDPACVELYRLLYEDATEANKGGPQELRWEFELAAFNVALPEMRRFADDLGITDAGPCLAVLDAGGAVTATYSLRLDSKGKLDGKALASFLSRHKLLERDAERLLAEALRQAKAEDRRVFLILSASWCGPCRRLARFLDGQHEELERHYVFVKLDIDRDAHATAVRARYQGKLAGGVPWYVILAPDGKALVTSNAPEADPEEGPPNIGFPSTPEGIDHFLRMLRQTAPRLTEERLVALRQTLAR